MKGTKNTPVEFFSRVRIADGCWNWEGYVDPWGYGSTRYEGRTWRAPRLARQFIYGDLDPELTIDHLCLNTTCVRPDHFAQVPSGVNSRRGQDVRRRGHCLNGHRFTPENTIHRPKQRDCRACRRMRDRKRREVIRQTNAAVAAADAGRVL